jgi:predicted ATPase/DNA-binding winged helix-turn-helix (wHTH) protein
MGHQTFPERSPTGAAIKFGSFKLFPDRHLLLQGDEPLQVGSRALEILIALTERGGELVTKDELLSRAWPNATVEESNLRAQVALLRKILGDNQAAPRFIAAVPGRGYRFVSPTSSEVVNDIKAAGAKSALPRRLNETIGRHEAVRAVQGRFKRSRLTTIVGPGGIGKTALCLAVAEQLLPSYEHGACFLDLAPLANAELVSSVLAAALGLADASTDPLPGIISHLRLKRMLLIFDSCELVVEAAARITESIQREAPGIDILATSREPLRAENESVYRLPPLEVPPVSAGLTAERAKTFSAVQLFVDRASAQDIGFELNDNEAPIVADICRQLDGIALAIELAASMIEAFGARGIAELLGDRFRLLGGGRRTALPRHQTLTATIDWSYEALSPTEQLLLRRLAVFAGEFTFEAVSAAVSRAGEPDLDLADHLARLVAKSLVVVDTHGLVARYRLLNTTRAYAVTKLSQLGEFDAVVRRVAHYLCHVLRDAHQEVEAISGTEWLSRYGQHINNVRMVLDWAYSPRGDQEIGLELTIAAIPLWYQLSSVDECLGGVQRALLSIGSGEDRNARMREVMQLYRALGLAQAFKVGFAPQATAAFVKALELAESLADAESQCEALWGLWLCQIGVGEYRTALETGNRFMKLAESGPDRVIGHRMISMTLFAMGDCRGARSHADRMLAHDTAPIEVSANNSVRFRFSQPVASSVQPAQLLWIQGFPDQAIRAVEHSVKAARASGRAISLCDALSRWACPVWIQVGDLRAADASITTLMDQAATNSLGPWEVFGRCWKGALYIKQGLVDRGITLLRTALEDLQRGRLFTLYNVGLLGFLAEGLAVDGRLREGRALIETAIQRSEEKEELWCVAELLRIKGVILAQEGASSSSVEMCFLQSIDWARRQDALSWELRTGISLAEFMRDRGNPRDAHQSLAAVYGRFNEGFGTADLKTAAKLLAELG